MKFHVSSRKSENLLLDGFLSLCLSQKSTEELCVITLKNDVKFEEELTCALKYDMKNLTNFDSTLGSLKICTLMGPFCPNHIKFQPKKHRRVSLMTQKNDAES